MSKHDMPSAEAIAAVARAAHVEASRRFGGEAKVYVIVWMDGKPFTQSAAGTEPDPEVILNALDSAIADVEDRAEEGPLFSFPDD